MIKGMVDAESRLREMAIFQLVSAGYELDHFQWLFKNGQEYLVHRPSGQGYRFGREFEGSVMKSVADPVRLPDIASERGFYK